MKTTELIQKLQELVEIHGDKDVFVEGYGEPLKVDFDELSDGIVISDL